MTAEIRPNRLAHESSPYLLQHAHNPVDWYPWGEEAFATARHDDRPILLSVGYSSCHWCHVMERESFEDESTAALMNRYFVNIKVDREERPDVDAIYMQAVQLLTRRGGWPMTVFLTPTGHPFYGGTYFPPEDRYGMPSFRRLLESIAAAWKSDRTGLERQGDTILDHLKESGDITRGAGAMRLSPGILDRASNELSRQFDARYGGFGSAPKFPQPALLDLLLRDYARTGRPESLEMVERTLQRMAQGGIYDQLGGGFHRYSTDREWLVPHFEKMLYDNAQLAQTYARVFQVTGNPFYREIARETLEYVLCEMTDPGGGFYTAQDADSEGDEGKFFVWSQDEIRSVLGETDAVLFAAVYDVMPGGNWEGNSILHVVADIRSVAQNHGLNLAEATETLDGARSRLFAARESRVHPALDDKVLAGWNGLMLAAMAECASAFDSEEFRQAAVNNAGFILSQLAYTDSEGHTRLFRTWRRGEAKLNGYLEDYAFCAEGLVRLYEATFDPRWVDAAIGLAETMLALFWDDEDGGFYTTASDHEPLIDRPKGWDDNAIPSGNSVAVEVLLRLGYLTDNALYRDRAERVLRRVVPISEQHPGSFARMLGALELYIEPVTEIAVMGSLSNAATSELIRTIFEPYLPNKVVAHAADSEHAPPHIAILAGRPLHNENPTAYVCRNQACLEPATTAAALREQLASALRPSP